MRNTVFVLIILLFSSSASADYLRALDAYRNADSKSVFSEIEDAVITKNNYAFGLFLNELQFGYKENPDNLITIKKDAKWNFTYPTVITKDKIPYLIQLLEASSNAAPSEFQYYFLKKRNYLLKQSTAESDMERYANSGVKKATADRAIEASKTLITKNELEWLEKSAKQGSIADAIRLAQVYLGWKLEGWPELKKDASLQLDPLKGIYWLKLSAVMSPVNTFSCKVAEEYLDGKNQVKNFKKAYEWYITAYSKGAYGNGQCYVKGFKDMAESGTLQRINNELAVGFLNMQHERPPYELLDKEIAKNIEPEELRIIQKEYFNSQKLAYSWSGLYYNLRVYKDGKVEYVNANDGYLDWRITLSEVKNLIDELQGVGFLNWPAHNVQVIPCDMGEIWTSGYAMLSTKNKVKYLDYITVLRAFPHNQLAEAYVVQEKLLPTKSFRCGTEAQGKIYEDCVNLDKWIFKAVQDKYKSRSSKNNLYN